MSCLICLVIGMLAGGGTAVVCLFPRLLPRERDEGILDAYRDILRA